jgi:glutaredoxin-like protein
METAPPAILVYGTTWCSDCRRAKQFLGEHRVPYAWIDIEQDEAAMREVERLNAGKRSVPTILFPDGSTLVEPSNDQLAEKLGLRIGGNATSTISS